MTPLINAYFKYYNKKWRNPNLSPLNLSILKCRLRVRRVTVALQINSDRLFRLGMAEAVSWIIWPHQKETCKGTFKRCLPGRVTLKCITITKITTRIMVGLPVIILLRESPNNTVRILANQFKEIRSIAVWDLCSLIKQEVCKVATMVQRLGPPKVRYCLIHRQCRSQIKNVFCCSL